MSLLFVGAFSRIPPPHLPEPKNATPTKKEEMEDEKKPHRSKECAFSEEKKGKEQLRCLSS